MMVGVVLLTCAEHDTDVSLVAPRYIWQVFGLTTEDFSDSVYATAAGSVCDQFN